MFDRLRHLGEDRLIQTRDVFALDRMGLNAFLFAAIGTEADGSCLTVLSTLARLGEDPWAKAASWAGMSRAAATEALSACIAQMPVAPDDLKAAPYTAARLVLLLSAPAATSGQHSRRGGSRSSVAVTVAMAAFTAVLLGAMLLLSQSGVFERTASPAPASNVAR